MAKKTAKDIIENLKTVLGESATSDVAIGLMEDITDSVDGDGTDWKSKYEENDKAWRQRYTDRFMGSGSDDDPEEEEPEQGESLTYEALFE